MAKRNDKLRKTSDKDIAEFRKCVARYVRRQKELKKELYADAQRYVDKNAPGHVVRHVDVSPIRDEVTGHYPTEIRIEER